MYVVEVRRAGEGLAEAMGRMRDWLDVHAIQPRRFQFDRAAFRLEFEIEEEAVAFAGASDGHIRGEPRARAA
jgi:hypothetical protein